MASLQRRCYNCQQLVPHFEFTCHLSSCLDSARMHHEPNPSLAAFSYDSANYDHCGAAFHSTPPPFRPQIEHDRPLYPATSDDELDWNDLDDILAELPADNHRHSSARTTPVRQRASQRLNAFHAWLENTTHSYPKYTTIDGQNNKPDSHAHFTNAAEILRRTTMEEVVKIVDEFEGLNFNHKKTCLELVQETPIFPGLVAYTYTHLVMCPCDGWFSKDDWSGRIAQLKRLVRGWKNSGNVECILSCDSIKKRLLEVLRETKVKKHNCNSALLNGTMVLDHDIRNLAALVVIYITGSQKNEILDQRGPRTDALVELFHNLLEADIEFEEDYRGQFFNPLIQFTKESGHCPRGIYLEKDVIEGLVPEGQGGFGSVFKGNMGSRLVAVKALNRNSLANLRDYSKQVSKEAIVWRHLRHPNCLPFYGVYTMPTGGSNISFALVSPWMNRGTLSTYLKDNPQASRTQLILDVVRGLDYLHSMQPHVAHRDIKPDNILITNKGRACLADFGLVSTFDTDVHFRTATAEIQMCGTCHYMAPELFNATTKEARRRVNKRESDMYALGCTIYEAYTGRPPFDHFSLARLIFCVSNNKRPEFPKDKIAIDMWSFVNNLWGPRPSKRLTAQQALGWMETKARQEGIDSSLAPFEEEWEWKGPRDPECLWSVSL